MAIIPFSPSACTFHAGDVYRHYKGTLYQILTVARHSETLEELIVYQDLNNPLLVWVRPLSLFLEKVSINGIVTPRFQLEISSCLPSPPVS